MKSAKNLNATPGFSFCKSILSLIKAHMLINTKCPYGSLAPSAHAADQSDDPDLWDCIPLFKEDSS